MLLWLVVMLLMVVFLVMVVMVVVCVLIYVVGYMCSDFEKLCFFGILLLFVVVM